MATPNPFRLISSAPRGHLFLRTVTSTHTYTRSMTTTLPRYQSSSSSSNPSSLFSSGPSPPRLPKAEQELFETLQRQSTGAFSTPRSTPQINQSPDSSAPERAEAAEEIDARVEKIATAAAEQSDSRSQFEKGKEFEKVIEARGQGEELHPAVRRGAQPEFEGDVNPKTGEVGGPKNEPLRWGASSEWTYNGRATDF